VNNRLKRQALLETTEWRNDSEASYVLARILHDIATVLEFHAGCDVEGEEQ
jgi:hypothetical protein